MSAKAASKSVELSFTMEKETKNTIRFQEEQDDPDERPAIGTLYITKKALVALGGNAKKLRVTVEAIG